MEVSSGCVSVCTTSAARRSVVVVVVWCWEVFVAESPLRKYRQVKQLTARLMMLLISPGVELLALNYHILRCFKRSKTQINKKESEREHWLTGAGHDAPNDATEARQEGQEGFVPLVDVHPQGRDVVLEENSWSAVWILLNGWLVNRCFLDDLFLCTSSIKERRWPVNDCFVRCAGDHVRLFWWSLPPLIMIMLGCIMLNVTILKNKIFFMEGNAFYQVYSEGGKNYCEMWWKLRQHRNRLNKWSFLWNSQIHGTVSKIKSVLWWTTESTTCLTCCLSFYLLWHDFLLPLYTT